MAEGEIAAVRVGDRRIGAGEPSLIVAEVAQAHDGSLGTAHAFIDAIADAGADAVKFQTHIAAAESTPAERFRVEFSTQDATRYDYWKRMEFGERQWAELAAHARERGLIFLSSPFSVEAVELLARVGVPAWKVASGQLDDTPTFEAIVTTGLPVLLSTGMSRLDEVDAAVARMRDRDIPFAILQATSSYPTSPEKVGLNVLDVYRERYGCPVGLSDHSGTIWPGVAAAALGASLIEVHVTLSRQMFGPDVTSSITTGDLAQMTEGIRYVADMLSHPVDKDALAANLMPIRELFAKSIVAAHDLRGGTTLERRHLAVKKPGGGIAPERIDEIVGRTLAKDVAADEMLSEEDFSSQ